MTDAERLNKKREYSRKYMQKWRNANREQYQATQEKWKKANREKCRVAEAKRRKANPEKSRQAIAKWKKTHPNRHKATVTIRGHRLRGFSVEITMAELEAILEKTKICPQCGVEFTSPRFKTVDRIGNAKIMTAKTIQILCLRCNVSNARRIKKEATYAVKVLEERRKHERRATKRI